MVNRPDFTPAEHDPVAELLRERFARPASLAVADSDLRLDAGSDAATSCLPFHRHARGVDAVRAFGRRQKRAGRGLR